MSTQQTILYIAAGFEGSTTLDRKRGLETAGCKIIHFDTDRWMRGGNRYYRGLHHRLHFGPLISSLNRAVVEEATRVRPDVVWVDKGVWLWPETVASMKQTCRLIVHFTPDSISFPFHDTPMFLRSIPEYDVMVTTKAWEEPDYVRRGARKVIHTHQGASTSRVRPLEAGTPPPYEADLVFVGRAEAYYVQTMLGLLSALPSARIRIWGDWKRAVKANPVLGSVWTGTGAYGDQYAQVLGSAKIGLCLLTKLVPETETTRSFEIPACRTMMLAERTASHQGLFQEGVEAEFFADVPEAVEKISRYLSDSEARALIAREGYRRFVDSDYTTDRFMRDCLDQIQILSH